MAFELKDGQGTLFRNTKKEEGSKQPDHRGEVMIGGQLFEIAGWVKDGKNGKFLSLKLQPAREDARKPKAKSDDPFDDAPF